MEHDYIKIAQISEEKELLIYLKKSTVMAV
jgi:hypothetical protein